MIIQRPRDGPTTSWPLILPCEYAHQSRGYLSYCSKIFRVLDIVLFLSGFAIEQTDSPRSLQRQRRWVDGAADPRFAALDAAGSYASPEWRRSESLFSSRRHLPSNSYGPSSISRHLDYVRRRSAGRLEMTHLFRARSTYRPKSKATFFAFP